MNASASILPRRFALAVFFLLAFGISWIVWIPAAAASWDLLPFPLSPTSARLLGVFGPSLAAIILTAATDKYGLRRLLGRLLVWRVGIRWYAFVLFWPAAISLVTTALYVLLGGSAPDFSDPPILRSNPFPPELSDVGPWPLLPLIFLQTLLISSPMGEEIGWRGYALPRLQAGQGAVRASVILGLFWGFWHLPLYLTRGDPLSEVFFGWFLLAIIADTILFTWVYNNTKGSLLLALLFHTSIAVTALYLASVETTPLLGLALRWSVVIIVIAVAGPARLSRRAPIRGGEF